MKKALGLILLCLASCSDDDNSFDKKDIVNKWYITSSTSTYDTTNYDEGYIACETDYFEFTPDNKFRHTEVSGCAKNLLIETSYTINGKQLLTNDKDSGEILTLSKNQMKIQVQYRHFINPTTPVIETVILTYKPVPQQ